MFIKMFSINKCLNCFNIKNSVLSHKFKFNINSSELQKRCFASELVTNFSQFICFNQTKQQFIENHLVMRCLSSNTSVKTWNARTETTTQSTQVLTEKPSEESVERRVVQPIGIPGIHKWEDLKNIKKWNCVYFFPYITHLRLFQRAKLWLTVMSVASVPFSALLCSWDAIPLEAVYFYSIFSLFSVFMVQLFGLVFRRVVGRVYISDNEKFVRLSHLTFFGHRIDEDIDTSDVVPLTDINFRLNDWYCRIERYSTSDLLFMSLKFGGIVDREGFEKVFGENSTKPQTK